MTIIKEIRFIGWPSKALMHENQSVLVQGAFPFAHTFSSDEKQRFSSHHLLHSLPKADL
jgi:hypothetical protein